MEFQAVIPHCIFQSLVLWVRGGGGGQTVFFFWRRVFLLPYPGEAFLNLVSQALPSAASEWCWWQLPLLSPDPPGMGHSWMGFPQEDFVMWRIYCENWKPKFLNAKLKGAWCFLLKDRKKSFQLVIRVFLLCLVWTEQSYLSSFKAPKRRQN